MDFIIPAQHYIVSMVDTPTELLIRFSERHGRGAYAYAIPWAKILELRKRSHNGADMVEMAIEGKKPISEL